MAVFPSTTLETLLCTQAAIPDPLGSYRVNWAEYFIACHRTEEDMRARGKDAGRILARIEEALEAQEPEVQKAVGRRLAEERRSEARRLSLLGRARAKLEDARGRLPGLFGGRRFVAGRSLSTWEPGFETILDCTRFLGALMRSDGVAGLGRAARGL